MEVMKAAAVSQYRDAIEHLPPGGMLVVQDVSWEEYERLLAELSDRPGVRVTYDRGRLQAVSPLRAHERYAQILFDLADLTAEALDLPLEPLGSTTLRQMRQQRGVEPDHAFCVANAFRVESKITLDLEIDPPPDVVIEIDLSSDSRAKLPIYARLGVPELWLYDGKRVQILERSLNETEYNPASRSRFLPPLTVEVLQQQIEKSKNTGRTAFRRGFRAWLAQLSIKRPS
jgi:Uma2 family endonuclease